LSAEQAEQLQKMARRLWANSLRQFLQTATVGEERSQGADGSRRSVRFGVYFHEAEQKEPGAIGGAKKKADAKAGRRKAV